MTWRRAVLFSTTVLLLCVYRYNYLSGKKVKKTTVPLKEMRYILQWGDPQLSPFNFMGKESSAFVKNGCEYTNCFVTSDKHLFDDVAQFDAVVFNGRDLANHLKHDDLPLNRSAKQKYVYANMESSHNYPVCTSFFNDFFNWTWTYKLNSDSRWGYFTIYDLNGAEVGPKVNMQWPKMDPIDNATKMRLASKSKAAAWFVSNCHSLSKRERFARAVAAELNKFNLSLNVIGNCGKQTCPRWNSKACYNLLAKDYYFYFAFENSFDEDYVTEKVVTALNNYAIPVVFGGANYSRFLPPGSYLDGWQLGPERLAEYMATIVSDHRHFDSSLYYDFFRWRNHFTYDTTAATSDICKLCKILNDPELMSAETVYRNFSGWWNSKHVDCKRREQQAILHHLKQWFLTFSILLPL